MCYQWFKPVILGLISIVLQIENQFKAHWKKILVDVLYVLGLLTLREKGAIYYNTEMKWRGVLLQEQFQIIIEIS